MNYTHIRLHERSVIQRLKNNKASVKQIAFIIGKHPSTVYREIKRNSIYNYYEAYKAGNSAYKRRFIKPKKIIKLGIEKEILKLLEIDCSPEKIHGRLKKKKAITVSTESIYQYIYSKPHFLNINSFPPTLTTYFTYQAIVICSILSMSIYLSIYCRQRTVLTKD